MELSFVNRKTELSELDAFGRHGGLLVVFGRRRIGKTRLLVRWLKANHGHYSQAIEATREQQLQQIAEDLRTTLGTTLVPRTWPEFFELLDLQKGFGPLCLDEFPYLVAADASLPSVLQRWLDHRTRKSSALILSGSSTRMMNDLFLNRAAPLYGRAYKLLPIEPMGYRAFCGACRRNPVSRDAFAQFALVGGVPRYWEFVRRGQSAVELADELFFGTAPFLEFEPSRLLKDEGIAGSSPLAVLEAVGRGAEKPSEIASRVSTPQTNLSRVFQALLDARILERQLPFGESVRSTRRTLYRIADPTLRFWFRVYSPHRSRWSSYPLAQRQKLLDDHASTVFEDCVRAAHPGAGRYWDATIELDLVREQKSGLIVTEVKWSNLSKAQQAGALASLEQRFRQSAFSQSHPRARFEVIDGSFLSRA
jgi:uncharacterized protein